MTTVSPLAAELASAIAPRVFRTSLDQPGFAHCLLGDGLNSATFRGLLVELGRVLAARYRQQFEGDLRFVSLSRFDQQAATRPHRDGGPDASILLLGYEPTEVRSRVWLLDYTRAAVDRQMTPISYLDCCNPAFGGDALALEAYATEVTAFDPSRHQLLAVNNSCVPYEDRGRGMLGLLHHAAIPEPRPGRTRVVNSVLLGVVADGVSEEELRLFAEQGTAATR